MTGRWHRRALIGTLALVEVGLGIIGHQSGPWSTTRVVSATAAVLILAAVVFVIVDGATVTDASGRVLHTPPVADVDRNDPRWRLSDVYGGAVYGGGNLGQFEIYDLDGVSWTDAPVPPRWHRCTPQTYAWHGVRLIERCACGAIRAGRGGWIEKNHRAGVR